MTADHPDGLVVTVVITDLAGRTAFGFTDPDGDSVCVVDEALLRNDTAARSAAFDAFVAQAAIQAERTP